MRDRKKIIILGLATLLILTTMTTIGQADKTLTSVESSPKSSPNPIENKPTATPVNPSDNSISDLPESTPITDNGGTELSTDEIVNEPDDQEDSVQPLHTGGSETSQLEIDAPAEVMKGSVFTVNITSNGSAVSNATVKWNDSVYVTNLFGRVYLTAPIVFVNTEFIIRANKSGYDGAIDWILVLNNTNNDPLELLEIDVPPEIMEGESFLANVTSNGSAIQNATVTWLDITFQTDYMGRVFLTAPWITSDENYRLTASKMGYQSALTWILVINYPTDDITELFVDDDYNQSTPGWDITHFDEIQKAINKATINDEIFVFEGEYFEHLTIDFPLSLIGSGYETTLIDGQNLDHVFQVNADDVKISGFTIKGSPYVEGNNYRKAGIWIESKNNIINNNHFIGNRYGIMLGENAVKNIIQNNIVEQTMNGYVLRLGSSRNLLTGSLLKNNKYGVVVDKSNNNNITNNTIFESCYI